MVPEIWSEKEIFVILDHFVALSEKSKFSKNEKKKPWRLSSFYTCVPQTTIMMYGS